MTSKWRLRHHESEKIATLSRAVDVPPLVAHLLLNRGLTTPALAHSFLEARQKSLHDPELLPGAVEASDRIIRAVRQGRKIVIYGDYDVDGVCGTSVLWECLKLAGATRLEYYIPHRVDEGYGLSADAIKTLAADHGAELIVTVDCGVTAIAEANLARELGIELIITDHHSLVDSLPDADVIVHPTLPGSRYPFPSLCGCGVAFKLAWQISKSFGDGKKASPHMRDFLVRSINLVAMATVADVVPLEDENRIFVRHGLKGLLTEPSTGLKALMGVSGCLGKSRLTAGTIGFNLGPRINAAGRLARAMSAVELLTTDDLARARELAQSLDECNTRRQEVERLIVAEAHELIEESGGLGDRGAIVLGKADWHPGVIGIVAGRLAEIYHRPTIIVALGGPLGQGSARSVPGFDLIAAIRACSDTLVGFGGHTAAAGLKVHPDQFPAFRERFDEHCRTALTPELRQKQLTIDAEVMLGELTMRVVDAIEQLEPYGIGNPRPILVAEGVKVVGEPRFVGERKNHVQLRFAQGNVIVKAIAWNLAARAKSLTAGTICSLAFSPAINEWNGRREVQLEVRDFHVHDPSTHLALPDANALEPSSISI